MPSPESRLRAMTTEQRESLARSARAAPSLLASLAGDARVGVRAAVAGNRRTPPRVLGALAEDRSSAVRSAVAGNDQCPGRALTRLADTADWRVRSAVAANPATPSTALRKLARDEDARVLEHLVQNPSCPSSAVATALGHRGTRRLRGLAAANPSISNAEVLGWLALWGEAGQDLEPLVEGIARRPGLDDEVRGAAARLAPPRLALRLPGLAVGQVRDMVARVLAPEDLEALAWHPLANRQILKGVLSHPFASSLEPQLLEVLGHEVRSAGAVRSRRQGEVLVLRSADDARVGGLHATSWAHRQLIRLSRQQAQPGPGLRLLGRRPAASRWYYGIRSSRAAEAELFAVGADQREPGEVSLSASGLTVFVHRELAHVLATCRLAYEPSLRREGFELAPS